MAPKPTPPPPPVAPASRTPPPKAAERLEPKKVFTVEEYDTGATGEKFVVYGIAGIGKTSLLALAPTPVFIALCTGSRKIKHPVTRKPLKHIPGVETYEDVRDALHSKSIWESHQTGVIDTGTILQALCEPYIFATIRKAENEGQVTNLEAYGYGKGYKHLVDTMRTILQDCDNLVNQGTNIAILCQQQAIRVANPAGEDYIQDGPDLQHNNQNSVRNEVVAWSDHCLRIGYYDVTVQGKKATGSEDNQRAIYLKPAPHFIAKSRTIDPKKYGVVAFNKPSDDSFWRILDNED